MRKGQGKMGKIRENNIARLYPYDQQIFRRMIDEGKIIKILDTVDQQIEDLFLIRNPEYRYNKNYKNNLKKFKKEILAKSTMETFGNWFYFPKSYLLVHYLPQELHQELRTARNRNLITEKEQKKFYNFSVGIAGLSVGSHAAFTLTIMGGGGLLKLADPDTLSASNLNRVRYDFTQIGKSKAILTADGIKKINPYSKLQIYPNGINENNITDFLAGPPKINVLVEEVDDLKLKFELRFFAKKHRIPVVMATDNGDNIIVDIERYDQEKNLPIFNGLVGNLTYKEFKKIPTEVLRTLVGNIVGIDYVTNRVLYSLSEVGSTLYSWPQLGDAANLCGSVITYLIKSLALNNPLRSGKYAVNLDNIFGMEE